MKQSALLLLWLTMLSACATTLPSAKKGQRPWRIHADQISQLNNWKITGKLSIIAPGKSGITTMHWKQSDDAYWIRLLTPLNQTVYELYGNDGAATIYADQQMLLRERTLTALLKKKLGWDIDATSLIYWVKGIPDPRFPLEQLVFDKNGLLSMMQQHDMQVRISRYQDVDGITLPEKILLKNKDIELKIFIKTWEI